MNEIKFITFTDPHVSDHNPQNRLGNYKGDILNKFKQIGDLGSKLDVDFFLCGGDLFDHKAPTRNSHKMNKELMSIFYDFGKPIYMTEGNHDLRNDSYENFDEQPLSVLYESGALNQLRNEVITKGDLKVALRAFPFEETPDLVNMPGISKDVDRSVCIMHIYSTPKGGMLFKQKLFSYDEVGVLGDDVFLMGHYHVDQGVEIIKTHGKDQHFINVGSLSRGALSDDNIKRSPKICLVTIAKSDSGEVSIKTEQICLKVKPPEEIFNLELKAIEKEKIKEAEEFVEKLQENITDVDMDKESIDSEILNLNIDQKVMDKVKYYINEARLQIEGVTN